MFTEGTLVGKGDTFVASMKLVCQCFINSYDHMSYLNKCYAEYKKPVYLCVFDMNIEIAYTIPVKIFDSCKDDFNITFDVSYDSTYDTLRTARLYNKNVDDKHVFEVLSFYKLIPLLVSDKINIGYTIIDLLAYYNMSSLYAFNELMTSNFWINKSWNLNALMEYHMYD